MLGMAVYDYNPSTLWLCVHVHVCVYVCTGVGVAQKADPRNLLAGFSEQLCLKG